MLLDFSGKVVAITGAGGAIGRAMAIRFGESGARVAVLDIGELSGQETVRLIAQAGGEAAFYRLDVVDRADAARVLERVALDLNGMDVLVNNAGINVGPDKRFPIGGFDDASWDRIVAVDLDGVYNVSKAALPHMAGRGGCILNISSVVGMVPFRNQCAFAAAKAGVINLTRAMALELAGDGIRVNAIAPGTIAMEGTRALWKDEAAMQALLSHIPQHRQGSPDDIAGAALFLCSEQAGYITGALLAVDGGWTCGYARDF